MERNKEYLSALAYATEKHAGQTRIGGDEYITHPVAVAQILQDKGYGIDYQICALFHDLLEDTDATEQEILQYSNQDVLQAVRLLTKNKGYQMVDYVEDIKQNPIAYAVKGADRLHNLRCALTTSEMFKKKYIKETNRWYLDFMPEISVAVKELENSLEEKGKH